MLTDNNKKLIFGAILLAIVWWYFSKDHFRPEAIRTSCPQGYYEQTPGVHCRNNKRPVALNNLNCCHVN